jgi:hypothetical protein
MRKLLFPVFLLAGILPAAAQSVAIRYIIGETHKVYKLPAFDNFCMGLGVDRTFNDRLTLGLDVAYDIGNALKNGGEYLYLQSGSLSAGYEGKLKLLSLNYHTEYALAANDGTHVYIGTFLGLRHISQTWAQSYMTTVYGDQEASHFPSSLKYSQWLVPIGLRMGVRGATDSGFLDLYTAFGYQIGGGKKVVEEGSYKTDPKALFSETSSLAITIGLAYGFGW